MKRTARFPLILWKLINRLNRGMLSHYTPRSKVASRVLVLTTIGRKSGQPRSTPLQYEELDEIYYVASARGERADWYRNLQACPQVEVQVGQTRFNTQAERLTAPNAIADFLELRIKRHPHFMGFMLRMEGLPRGFTRQDLEKLAQRLAVVRLTPAGR